MIEIIMKNAEKIETVQISKPVASTCPQAEKTGSKSSAHTISPVSFTYQWHENMPKNQDADNVLASFPPRLKRQFFSLLRIKYFTLRLPGLIIFSSHYLKGLNQVTYFNPVEILDLQTHLLAFCRLPDSILFNMQRLDHSCIHWSHGP